MTNEVPLEVVIDTQVETLEILNVYKIRIDVEDAVLVQEIHYILVISLAFPL